MQNANSIKGRRDYSHFTERPDRTKDVRTSTFDKSHDTKTTFSMGQLIPFVTQETLPGDSWEISANVMMRFAPLYLPIMHRCDVSINYFYVPNRILWPEPSGWASFISQKEELEWPWFEHPIQPNVIPTSSPDYYTVDYMGFPMNLEEVTIDPETNVNISALPLSAYLKIWDEYYRNPQIQTEAWYPLIPGENDLTVWPLSGDSIYVRRKLWNRDYFTSALPTPQSGAAILVPMFNPDYTTPATGNFSPDGPWRMRDIDTGSPIAGGTIFQGTYLAGESQSLGSDSEAGYIDIQETAATISQFRLAARLQEFMERLMRVGNRYRDFIKGFFPGVDPDAGVVDVPVLIGGMKGNVVISEVLATAETTVDTTVTPLGSYAGQALSMEGTPKFNYRCSEHGWIIGIICVTPRTSYYQGMPRFFNQRQTPLDYAWEQFSEIGDQPILYQEINFNSQTTGADRNLETFGYIPRYSEYRWSNDIISGQMRFLWESFHLGRKFIPNDLTSPVLDNTFVTCFPNIDRVFRIGAAQHHEIYAHIWNEITVRRQLPKFGIPQL